MMVCGTRRFQRRGHWGEFGMMGMRARFFGPGEVRLALLSLIAVRFTWVDSSIRVTVALGITASLLSVTVPDKLAPNCA